MEYLTFSLKNFIYCEKSRYQILNAHTEKNSEAPMDVCEGGPQSEFETS